MYVPLAVDPPKRVLRLTADRTLVRSGRNTGVTADLTFNSLDVNTASEGTIPDGIEVQFSTARGTFDPPIAYTLEGETASVFTAGTPDGPADLMATVDNQTVMTTIEIGTLPFTDDPLIAGVTLVRAVHITELQVRINGIRARLEMTASTFTPVNAGMMIDADHVLELRSALAEAYVQSGLAKPSYTGDPASASLIRASHVSETRAAVLGIE